MIFGMDPVPADHLAETIAYAIWRNISLRPRRRSLDDARILAQAIVEHIERCGIECRRRPPARWHSWPPRTE
jgi:hypothetical protein